MDIIGFFITAWTTMPREVIYLMGMLLAWATFCWGLSQLFYKFFMSDSFGRFLDSHKHLNNK